MRGEEKKKGEKKNNTPAPPCAISRQKLLLCQHLGGALEGSIGLELRRRRPPRAPRRRDDEGSARIFTRGGVSHSGRRFDSLGWNSEGERLRKKRKEDEEEEEGAGNEGAMRRRVTEGREEAKCGRSCGAFGKSRCELLLPSQPAVRFLKSAATASCIGFEKTQNKQHYFKTLCYFGW